MSKFLNFLMFLILGNFLISASLQAQTIKGTIANLHKQPLPGVLIYFNNTQIHTTSDNSGSFSITNSNKSGNIIIFEKEGFKTLILPIDSVSGGLAKVTLFPVQTLKPVTIRSTSTNDSKFITYFLNTFIGEDRR